MGFVEIVSEYSGGDPENGVECPVGPYEKSEYDRGVARSTYLDSRGGGMNV